MKRTRMTTRILQVFLLILMWIGADFSPSYSTLLLFCAAFLLWTAEQISEKKRLFRLLKCAAGTVGGVCLYPSLLVYTAQDDHFVLYCKVGVVMAFVLQVSLEVYKKKSGKKIDFFFDRLVLLGAAFTAFFSMFTNAALIPYAAGLFLLYALREIPSEMMHEVGLLASLFLLALFPLMPLVSGTSVRGITETLASVRSPLAYLPDGGEKILYANTEKVLEAGEERFLPGAVWLDTDGNPIQAHGGKIMRMPVPDENGEKVLTYVWIGEDKRSGHFSNSFAVYTSDDLHSWTFGGDVLRSVTDREELDKDPYFSDLYRGYTAKEKDFVYDCIGPGRVMERPKMLYNEKNDQYVIWFHNDGPTEKSDHPYDRGWAGIAVSDSPFGPFRLVDSRRLSLCPKGQIDCFPGSKGEARDMNLFQEEDGTAYIVYTSENNKTLYISKLNEDYTDLSAPPQEAVYGEDYIRLFPGTMREAPVLCKAEGRYYLMSSSTTGWASNGARIWSANSLFGEWHSDGNPCLSAGKSIAYDTQCTSLFQGPDDEWIYYGDRWQRNDLADSRYVWLPVTFEKGRIRILWEEEWK